MNDYVSRKTGGEARDLSRDAFGKLLAVLKRLNVLKLPEHRPQMVCLDFEISQTIQRNTSSEFSLVTLIGYKSFRNLQYKLE